MLERESAFYRAHQVEFREKYLDKWLVIVGEELFGAFDIPKDAIDAARKQFGNGSFMVHRPMDDDAVLKVGPMGIVKIYRPYAPPKRKARSVIAVSGGELVKFAHA